MANNTAVLVKFQEINSLIHWPLWFSWFVSNVCGLKKDHFRLWCMANCLPAISMVFV